MASSSAGKTKKEATSKAAIDRQEVRVSTTPIRAAIARDQRKDDFEVLVTVEAPKVVAPEKRAPIDLVAVLDVSGSMNKEEFVRGKHMSSRLDLLKIAMKYIIKLVRDADRLAIVSFNHAVVSEYGLTRNSADSRKKLENLKI
uniref:VWFA domain-containing protein n=1 Tax=Oryza glumipatula TaxID=40148 RepID=A0A0E0BM62_9ORYZ